MSEKTSEFVTFYLDNQAYAIDIRLIREVNPHTRITPVPRSEPHVRGLVNIRGQIILVLDISVIFGRAEREVGTDSHILIIKTSQEISRIRDSDIHVNPALFGDKPVGFLIDSLGEVAKIPGNAMEPPPPHLDEVNARFFLGVTHRSDRLISILNLEELLIYGFNPAAGETISRTTARR